MKTKEVKKECANVVVIANESDKLRLEIGNRYEYSGKILTITAKRTHTEENPTTGKKTLWSGDVDGEIFTEVDVTKLRKLFGLAERKREKSAGKTFEHEGYIYTLDETADAMIERAFARFKELKSLLFAFANQYHTNCIDLNTITEEEVLQDITKRVEVVCLARKVAADKEAERLAAEKEAKAKASKEHREKVKQAKSEFFALLSSGAAFAEVTAKIAEKYGLQITELA